MVRHSYSSRAIPPEIHPVETLEHASLKDLFSAWTSLRGNVPYPEKPAALLSQIKPLISHLHLTEVVDQGADFRFRLIGEEVFPGLREHQVGKLITEHPDHGVRLRFLMLLRATYGAKRPVRGLSHRLTEESQYNYRIESLWLPFGRDREVNRILAMSVFERSNG